MPRLYALGQKFNVGSDDFFLPAVVGVFNKVAFTGIGTLFAVMSRGTLLEPCNVDASSEEKLFTSLVAGVVALSAIALGVYSSMLYVSTRGTPCDEERRGSMPSLVLATVVVYLLELGFAGGLTYTAIIWPTEGVCETTLSQKFLILLASTICLWVDFLAFCFAAYIFLHRYDAKYVDRMHLDSFDQSTLEWENCFKSWCRIFRVLSCNLFGYVASGEESDEIYRSVAEVFNTWFTNTGLTLTDLLTAAILVRLDQKAKRRADSRYEKYESPKSEFYRNKKAEKKPFNALSTSFRALQVEDPADLEKGETATEAYMVFKKHYEYLPYIIGMYGWKLMLYSHTVSLKPFTGLRKALKMPNKAKDIGHGDNCLMCSKNALLQEANLSPDQVIYGNFGSVAKDSSKSVQVPHAVFADHKRKAVVVAMRGTLSLQDLMTDAMVEPESLVEAGRTWGFNGGGHYAHSGMLKAALRIRRILEKNQVLHHMLNVEPKKYESTDNQDLDGMEAINVLPHEIPDCEGYELIITGHSLGAAAAMLLTLCLRPTFPQARCLAFAAPGAVVSYELAEECKEWCTNVWLGNDIVPHLNWQSLSNLRLKVFDMLYRCKVSKAEIFRSALLGKSTAELLYEPFEVPDTEGRRRIKSKIEEFQNKRKSKKLEQIPMYSPGQLIHLVKVETVHERRFLFFSKKTYVYEPYIVPDRKVMEDPVISTRSLFDHFPNLLPIFMTQVVERHGDTFAASL